MCVHVRFISQAPASHNNFVLCAGIHLVQIPTSRLINVSLVRFLFSNFSKMDNDLNFDIA